MEQRIYATLEQARKLQEAGWETPTHFSALMVWASPEPYVFETKKGYGGGVHDHDIAGFIYLPTIAEIPLHESVIVLQHNDKWRIWRKGVSHEYSSYTQMELYPFLEWGVREHKSYDSQLLAYIDAWILSKKQLPKIAL